MRLIGYMRVSQMGDRDAASERFQSIEQQRTAIEHVVALTDGSELVDEFVDLNVSGGTMDRPNVQEIVRRVDAGEADGVVVYSLDRWGRTLGVLETIERWAEEGKTFISATDSFNAATPAGRLALRMMIVVARYYWEQTQQRWRDSQRGAIRRGAHVGGTPTGYGRDDNGRLHPHPETGPHVTECFRLAAAAGHQAAAAYALEHLRVNSSNLRTILSRRVYLGEVHHTHGGSNLTAHDPLTDPRTWQAAQSRPRFRAVPGDFPLSGILRCRCGQTMSGQNLKRRDGSYERRYRCANHERRHYEPTRKHRWPETFAVWHRTLKHATIKAGALEETVRATVAASLGDVQIKTGTASVDLAGLEAALQGAEEELTSFATDLDARRDFGDEAWRAGTRARREAVEQATSLYQSALGAAREVVTLPAADELGDDEQLRRALAAMVDAIDVKTGRGMSLQERVSIRWVHDGDDAAGMGGTQAVAQGV